MTATDMAEDFYTRASTVSIAIYSRSNSCAIRVSHAILLSASELHGPVIVLRLVARCYVFPEAN